MTKGVTMHIDDTLKKQAEEMLEEIGINMASYFTASLKALVREKKVPFELSIKEKANAEYLQKLDMALEDILENGGYEYFGDGKFSDTLQKIEL